MAGARFDILFAGELMAGADPEAVRARIRERFKLSEEAAERLFDGRPVTVKHAVDTAAASRYREIFRKAGALVRIRPIAPADGPAHGPTAAPAVSARPGEIPADPAAEVSRLSLAPMGDDPLEPQVAVVPRRIDVSHLSLVPGRDWTLADCESPPPPIELPYIGHLRLVEPERTQAQGAETGQRATG